LALVSKIVNVLDERVGLAYDIGCSFSSMLQKSSLKDIVSEKKLCMMVNAFHGYAHSWPCQLSFHPLYVASFGLEDGEICECIFSSFSGLAAITRHVSQYHWHQAIDIFAQQWDEDKYMELCKSCAFLQLLSLTLS